MDNDDFNFRDPFDRLDDLELMNANICQSLEEVGRRIKDHSHLGVKMSSNLLEIIRTIDVIASKVNELEYRINQLEKK